MRRLGGDRLEGPQQLGVARAPHDETRAAQKKHHEDRVRDGVASPGDGPEVYNYLAEYNGPRKFLTLGQDLARRGWSTARIDKVLGGNFARLFGEVWDA